MARYRDASGLLQEVSTGCRDKSNAAIFLANMEAMIERIKLAPAGVLYGQKQSIPDIFSGKPLGLSGHEKTPVLLANTGVFDSRGDRTPVELFWEGTQTSARCLRTLFISQLSTLQSDAHKKGTLPGN